MHADPHIKAFVSRQEDRARLAYARRAGEFPRQCIFIGSTNDREYLKDDTGGRRFWPIECMLVEGEEIDTARLGRNVDQIWAEALHTYRAMRAEQPKGNLPLYLRDDAARTRAEMLQESRRIEGPEDGLAGQIAAWLDAPINTGSLDNDTEDDGSLRYRNETCLMQIWRDCLNNDTRSYNQGTAQMLGRALRKVPGWSEGGGRFLDFSGLGKQRVYFRGGWDGKLSRDNAAAQLGS